MTYGHNYELVKLNSVDVEHIRLIYDWLIEEDELDRFTPKPIVIPDFDKYLESVKHGITNNIKYIYLLKLDSTIVGRITLFSINVRNRSAEFGYYIIKANRGQGLGRTMIRSFIKSVFEDENLNLHKLVANTLTSNYYSTKLLEGFGFKLDGVLRDEFWFADRMESLNSYSLLRDEWCNGK